MDKVYTIVVTYNGVKWIEKCLQHLLASKFSTSIIVIDNNSTDETIKLLQPYLNKIELIKNENNIGFGAGNNIGIKRALKYDADFIFLLNQDAYVNEDCIGSLVTTLKGNPSFGIISPLQLDSSGQHLDKAFKNYIKNFILEEELEKALKKNPQPVSSAPVSVRFVNATSWMISKSAVKTVGLFHRAFNHYGEDNNYSSRLQYHQFKIGVSFNDTVIHDRYEADKDTEKLLLRKLKTVPLYTLLDIRKPFAIAYLSGFIKLKRIKKKLATYYSKNIHEVFTEQKKWFTTRLKEGRQIRKETKKIYNHFNEN